ncbi:MAG: hypothetical protein M0P57_04910 [Syntrophales bacterium]|jgi:MerR family transcriptional regulator/heat shock protein HspR|nr:hypothetical protein [Syntrophales bacterium]MDY0043315.1 chaperone modulator CbpM [Syntrophales bacterium]
MEKDFWTVKEVLEIFEIKQRFLDTLEEEDIVCTCFSEKGEERGYHSDEMEKLRVAKILAEDLEVNLAGIDIILRLRQQMVEMRRQFDDILEDLAKKIQSGF